jgi:hypothetical protein
METVMRKTTRNTEVRDELSGDELNALMGGWFGQWINGGGSTSGSGGGLVITGESMLAKHWNEIDIY